MANIINNLNSKAKYNGGNTGVLTPIYACRDAIHLPNSDAFNYGWQCPIIEGLGNIKTRIINDPEWATDFFCDGQGNVDVSRLENYGCIFKADMAGWTYVGQDDGTCTYEGVGLDFCCPNWQCPQDCGNMYGTQFNGCGECNCGDPQYGCTDPNACNYNSNAQVDNGSCYWAQQNYDCDGNCIATIDNCGTCGGTCFTYCDCNVCGSVDDCNHDCDGTQVDECGVCGGSGPGYECWNGHMQCDASECPDQPYSFTQEIRGAIDFDSEYNYCPNGGWKVCPDGSEGNNCEGELPTEAWNTVAHNLVYCTDKMDSSTASATITKIDVRIYTPSTVTAPSEWGTGNSQGCWNGLCGNYVPNGIWGIWIGGQNIMGDGGTPNNDNIIQFWGYSDQNTVTTGECPAETAIPSIGNRWSPQFTAWEGNFNVPQDAFGGNCTNITISASATLPWMDFWLKIYGNGHIIGSMA